MGRAIALTDDLVREKLALLSRSIRMVRRLRRAVYEDLNQLQHEHLCLLVVARLRGRAQWSALKWYYHPRQTSHCSEADVVGRRRGRAVVQAEVTTAGRPVGSIRDGMRRKLRELVDLPGKHKFYCVATRSMQREAKRLTEGQGIVVEFFR